MQVIYSRKLAQQLHLLPLIMALSLPAGARLLHLQHQPASKSQGSGAPRAFRSLMGAYGGLVLEASAALLSMVLAMLVPAAFAILRVLLLGAL